MAKITAEFDTKTKELKVTQDGRALANVDHISLGRKYHYEDGDYVEDGDKYGLYISMCDKSKMETDGFASFQSLQANEKGEVIECNELLANNKDFFNQFLNRK